MYAKQTVYDAHLKSKKHIKAAAREEASEPSSAPKTGDSPPPTIASRRSKHYKAAQYTHTLSPLLIPLIPTLNETKSNIERRFALTAKEREEEAEADAASAPAGPPVANGATGQTAPAEEDDEEERIYNPLKLPLGWDGKPIPYWLYKLHGLGVEYRCEICSDAVYMGRKNFDRHFQVSWIEALEILCCSNLSHLGISSCLRNEIARSTEHEALPRNYSYRGCTIM
jgi:splicing factor 3A subunit 3